LVNNRQNWYSEDFETIELRTEEVLPWVKIIEHERGFYSLTQVSEITGVPRTTIIRNEGDLLPYPAKRVGEIKMRLYSREQVEQIKKWKEERMDKT